MFTRFSKSSIVSQQPKLNSALAGNAGLSIVVFAANSGNWTYVNVPVLSNQIYFTNCIYPLSGSNSQAQGGGCASTTRGVLYNGDAVNGPITYTTFATRADAQNFGAAVYYRVRVASISSATRGVIAGGDAGGSAQPQIEYITIATTGNGTGFGNLATTRSYMIGGAQSPTRGVFAGGWTGAHRSEIDYITTASTGNATSFGSLTVARYMPNGFSSDTRGIWAGGNNGQTTIDYITIASTGNATSFGSLLYGNDYSAGAGSSNVRGVISGSNSGAGNQMTYVTIASTGNSVDFGKQTGPCVNGTMQSNHGGLQ